MHDKGVNREEWTGGDREAVRYTSLQKIAEMGSRERQMGWKPGVGNDKIPMKKG